MRSPEYNDTKPKKALDPAYNRKGSTPTKSKVTKTDKSFYDKKVKVSQSTIDDIKKMGMAKALKLAGQNSKASQGGLVKEYQEATRRLYGEKRFAAATGGAASSKAKYTSPDAAKAANKPAKYKSPDAAKSANNKPAASKAPAKKSSGIGGTLKKIATDTIKGTAKDVLTFGAGGASVGASLGAKAAVKAGAYAAKKGILSKSGQIAAKAGKPVSQSQYDAMLSNASKLSKTAKAKTAAKNAAATTAKKATAAKTATKKVASNTSAKLKSADEARMAAMRTPAKKPATKAPTKRKK